MVSDGRIIKDNYYHYLWILSELLDLPTEIIRWEIWEFAGILTFSLIKKADDIYDLIDRVCYNQNLINFIRCIRYILLLRNIDINTLINEDSATVDNILNICCFHGFSEGFLWFHNQSNCILKDIDWLLCEAIEQENVVIVSYIWFDIIKQGHEKYITEEFCYYMNQSPEIVEWFIDHNILTPDILYKMCKLINDRNSL